MRITTRYGTFESLEEYDKHIMEAVNEAWQSRAREEKHSTSRLRAERDRSWR